MKNLFTLFLMLAVMTGYSQKATNTWDGSFNSYWHNNSNWSLGHIPTSTEDVIIPNGMPRYPSVDIYDEEIKSLIIHSNAEVRVYDQIFEIAGDLTIYGELKILHADARLECNDISWEGGSEAQVTGSCDIMVFGTWEFKAGANVQLEDGRAWFYGSNDQYIRSKDADCYFNDVYVQKYGGVFGFSSQSTATCKIKGSFSLAGSNYDFLSYSNESIQIGRYLLNNNPSINIALDNGTIEITGYPLNFTFKPQPGDYINNLIVNTGTYDLDFSPTYTTTFEIKGDVTINSGRLDANGMDLLVGGDWDNNVGLSGFEERDEKVTFNGSGHQYCSDEYFYTLEIDKPSGALRINGSDVTCEEYDWTDGAIDVLSGSFTANELLDAGIAGEWYVNDEVHIHQNVGYIDLLGELHIYDGGYMHVYGGSDDSYWPYGASGSHFEIESGGALKFYDVGINIRSTGTLTTNITGGWIGMAGDFKIDRADFSAPLAIWAMQGLTDTEVEITQGQISQLDIDKLTGKASGENLNMNFPYSAMQSAFGYDAKKYSDNKYVSTGIYTTGFIGREGKVHNPTRANTVSVASNFSSQKLGIYGGTFNLNGHTINLSIDMGVLDSGILKMTNSLDEINLPNFYWYSGSDAMITAGDINISGNWHFENGTNAQLGTGNTVNFVGDIHQHIYCYDADAEFGSVVINQSGSTVTWLNSASTQPIRMAGGLNIKSSNIVQVETETLIVDGVIDIENGGALYLEDVGGELINNSDMSLTGKIEVDGGEAIIHGVFDIVPTGELTIGGGTFIVESDYWSGIYGSLTLTDGVLDFRNSIHIGELASTVISGGLFKVEHSFKADFPGTFEPTGGTVEFYNESQSLIECTSGNFFYNLDINDSEYVWPSADLLVAHNLNINSGTFSVSDQIVEVGNAVNIFGTLAMTNSMGVLECGNKVSWKPGSTDNITAGNIYTLYWAFEEGTDAKLGTGNTVHLSGGNSLRDPDAEFGNLVLGPWSKSGKSMQTHPESDAGKTHLSVEGLNANAIKDGKTVYPRRVAGNCTHLPGSSWNSPMDIIIQGTLDIQEGASQTLSSDNTIYTYSDFILNGTLDLGNEGNGHVEGDFDIMITGNLIIEGGQFTVISDVWTYLYGSLTMTAGVLELQNSLSVEPSAEINLSGGTIKIENILDATEPNTFQPTGGTVEFFGNSESIFYCNNGNFLYNLKINKAPSNGTYVGQTTTILNNLIIDGGTFGVSYIGNPNNIEIGGDVEVNEGGTLRFKESVHVLMGNGSNINVNDGGTIKFLGSSDENAFLSSASGYYNFNVWSGGVLAAEHATFEKMTATGIHFHTGSTIDHTSPFSYCTLQAGASGGTMLSFDNEQVITLENVSFYSDGQETYNVSKTNDQGSITFVDFSGDFAGAAYENDPHNRIIWFEPELSVTPSNRDVSAVAGMTTFSLVTNTPWSVSESLDWLTVNPTAGNNSKILIVDYIENTSLTPRVGEIIISGVDVPDVMVTVTQAGADPVLEVTPTNRDVSAAAGTTTFDLVSNTSWTVSENLGWLSVAPAGGSNNATLTVDYLENTSITPRTGNITISASGTPDVIVSVSQAGANNELSVSPSNQQVGIMPGTTTFDIMSNTSWNVTESVIWLSTDILNGTGNAALNVSYQGNYSAMERVGEITITTDSKIAITVTVTQMGISPTLAVDPESLDFQAPFGIGFLDVFSNTTWTITDNMDWLGLNYDTPSGDQTVQVSVDMNLTGMVRTGEITVETEDGSVQIIIPVRQGYFVEHIISIPAGWSGLSSFAIPTPPFIEQVFSDISDELIIALTEDEIYYPEYGINTIGMWDDFSAYKVKTNAAVDLEIYGSSYLDKTISIPAGWSLMPVISECDVNIEMLFDAMADDVVMIKDIAGYGVYWPQMGINTIGVLQPGMAYFILTDSEIEITFPACSKTSTRTSPKAFDFSNPVWPQPQKTTSSHSIFIHPDATEGLEPGTMLGAFDQPGNCFGLAKIGTSPNYITIFGDDQTTPKKDGFDAGEKILFRAYHPTRNECSEVEFDWSQSLANADGTFTHNGMSAIRNLKQSGTGTHQLTGTQTNVYPNPSSGKVFIEGFLPGSTIRVLDMQGQMIFESLLHNNDVQQISLDHLNPGAYMLIIRNGFKSSSHKLMLK